MWKWGVPCWAQVLGVLLLGMRGRCIMGGCSCVRANRIKRQELASPYL